MDNKKGPQGPIQGHAREGLDASYMEERHQKPRNLGEIKPSEKTQVAADDAEMKNPGGDFEHPSAKP